MTSQTWWYLARASGYVAWALVSASVVTGLLFSTRLTKSRATPAWTLDLHRFLAGTAVAFTALHIVGLVADSYVHFGVTDVLLPFASSWKPAPVALGVVALYLLAAIEISSLLMRRLPRKLWRSVHLTSYALFWLATFHLLTAGTDVTNFASRVSVALVMTSVVFLSLVRALVDRPGRARRATSGLAVVERRASATDGINVVDAATGAECSPNGSVRANSQDDDELLVTRRTT